MVCRIERAALMTLFLLDTHAHTRLAQDAIAWWKGYTLPPMPTKS